MDKITISTFQLFDREAGGDDFRKLKGIIEVDETYIGGKELTI